LGIGQTNIFGGKNDQAAGDKKRVLTGIGQASQVMKGGVDIRGTQRFNKGGDGVVVFVAGFVVPEAAVLSGLFDVGNGEGARFS